MVTASYPRNRLWRRSTNTCQAATCYRRASRSGTARLGSELAIAVGMGRAKAAKMSHWRGKPCEVANPRDCMEAYVPGGRSESIIPPSQG